jgi:hypothetical protein
MSSILLCPECKVKHTQSGVHRCWICSAPLTVTVEAAPSASANSRQDERSGYRTASNIASAKCPKCKWLGVTLRTGKPLVEINFALEVIDGGNNRAVTCK